jgi:hypothetical protein
MMDMKMGALKKWLAKNAGEYAAKGKEGAKKAGNFARQGAEDAKKKAKDFLGYDYDTKGGFPDRGELVAPKMSKNGKMSLAALAALAGGVGGGAGYAMSGDDDKPKKKRPY